MKTIYKVKLMNDFTEPYWSANINKDKYIVRHKNFDEYIAYDKDVLKTIVEDLVDAPKNMLTEEDIRKDFDNNRNPKMPASKIEAIMVYYNGRFELKKKIDSDLAKIDVKNLLPEYPVVLKYNIPFKMNYFSCDENDPYDVLTKMNDAYLIIEISKEND